MCRVTFINSSEAKASLEQLKLLPASGSLVLALCFYIRFRNMCSVLVSKNWVAVEGKACGSG